MTLTNTLSYYDSEFITIVKNLYSTGPWGPITTKKFYKVLFLTVQTMKKLFLPVHFQTWF